MAFVGDSGVGKTSIIKQHLFKQFQSDYNATIEDFYSTCVKVSDLDKESKNLLSNDDDFTYEFDIVDTAGLDEFKKVRESGIAKCDAYVFVYSLTSLSTLTRIHELLIPVLR